MREGKHRALLIQLFEAAVAAAHPARRLAPSLPQPPAGQVVVVGAGKAAAAMAQAVEAAWASVLQAHGGTGFVVVPYGYHVPSTIIEIIEAAHPLADMASEKAAQRALALVRGLSSDDLVLVLLSGGGSALLAAPISGLTLAQKQDVVAKLMRAGAPIRDLNCVRKHLSTIKGGRLAIAAYPARVVTLAISDVPGDAVDLIASGPTVPDSTTATDALRILDAHKLSVAPNVRAALMSGDADTPKPGDSVFANAEFHLIARPSDALDAAAEVARTAGFEPMLLGDAVEGEARDVAERMTTQALLVRRGRFALLSGGEVTVTHNTAELATGGPNREFTLALAVALDGAPDITALAADTDGIDGLCDPAQPVAGAIIDATTVQRARALGIDASAYLAQHRSGEFFAALGDEIGPGPTHTNVNDFRVVLIDK